VEEHVELWLAFLACLILAAFYAVYAVLATPSGGHPFGHFIGVVGMVLMLVTETVYSVRKRIYWLHWVGSLRLWLSFHIFTGIVGPFLVLLHTAFAVSGLAGLALVMTGLVVLSGFVGRYVYTAVPRTRAGIELSRDELAARAQMLQKELDEWIAHKPALIPLLTAVAAPTANTSDWLDVLIRPFTDLAYDQRVRSSLRGAERTEPVRLSEVKQLLRRQHQLERQIASLEWVQRMMGVWRLVHVPLGITLFTTAFLHVLAALYFKGLRF
jgi:hypothetical protein